MSSSEQAVRPEMPVSTDVEFMLDGRSPDAVLEPASEQEALESLAWATRNGHAVVPVGGATHWQFGNLLRAEKWAALCTCKLAGIVDYSAEDMVVTARPGTTLAELQAVLAQQRQFLPLTSPVPQVATIGGIVATNRQGRLRAAFGAPRDRLLGARIATSSGKVIRGGGRVVKNVAGYDLCKLFAGSQGTLGLLTEITLKTNPMPEEQRSISFLATSLAHGCAGALRLQHDQLDPAGSILRSGDKPVLSLLLLGSKTSVDWQEKRIAETLTGLGLVRSETGSGHEDWSEPPLPAIAPAAFRLQARPTECGALSECLLRHCGTLSVVPAAGIVEGVLAEGSDEDVLHAVQEIASTPLSGGYLTWQKLPASVKHQIDSMGPKRDDFELLRGVKHTMDPAGMFSPGRGLGGI